MSKRVRLGVVLMLVLSLALLVTGCQQAADNAAKNAVAAAAGVKVEGSGDSVTITGNDGSTTTVGKTLPVGMPSDMPVYQGTIVTSGKSTTSDGTTFSFSMETADGAQKVSDWYKGEFEKGGWTVDNAFSGTTSDGVTAMLSAKKGTSEAQITAGEQSGKTTIIAVLVVK